MTTNFKKFLEEVVIDYDENFPRLRWGQTYLNVLSRHQPNMVLKIFKDQKFDPFYNDKIIPEFLTFVKENWGVYD
jgi:hypothetical protein